jgi:hydrogenase maturation protein HypF
MGRLFDAVASLIGVRQQINYEGQAAIELESLSAAAFQSTSTQAGVYPYQWEKAEAWELHLEAMLRQVIEDFLAKTEAGVIGARFHNTLAHATREMCVIAREETGIGSVGLTGGVFQNVLLTRLIRNLLEEDGFQVFTHRQVPPNDAGLALGQALIARTHIRAL